MKKDENNNCLNKLNELRFCEVSSNSISNWTWKFQLSILKNKKVLFLKNLFLGRSTKIDPKDGVSCLNFPTGFVKNNKLQINNYKIVVNFFIFISVLYFFSFLLQWLSIGTGYGDMEEKIIKSIPDINIDHLVCYEPGNEQFKHLKSMDFGLQNKPIIHHEVFDESTILGKSLLTFLLKYQFWKK